MKTKRLGIRMDEETYEELLRLAKLNGRTASDMIRQLVLLHITRKPYLIDDDFLVSLSPHKLVMDIVQRITRNRIE